MLEHLGTSPQQQHQEFAIASKLLDAKIQLTDAPIIDGVVGVGVIIAGDSAVEAAAVVIVEISNEAEDDKDISCNTSGKFDLRALKTLWCIEFFDMVTPNCWRDAIKTS